MKKLREIIEEQIEALNIMMNADEEKIKSGELEGTRLRFTQESYNEERYARNLLQAILYRYDNQED